MINYIVFINKQYKLQWYTSKPNLEDRDANLASDCQIHIQSLPNEEDKQANLKENASNSEIGQSRPTTELNINFEDYNVRTDHISTRDNAIILKVKDILKNRRKYQAS